MPDYYDSFEYGNDSPTTDILYSIRESRKEEDVDYLGAAFESAFTPFAVQRYFERKSQKFESDQRWAITPEIEKDLDQNYDNKETEYLKDTNSEAEFIARKKQIAEDRERRAALGQAGLKGVAATMAVSLIDPVGIGLGIASGGIGWGAKATGAARVARVAFLSGLENAAVESLLAASDTQASASDVVTALGAGAIIGGTIGALSRGRKPNASKAADEADRAAQLDSDGFILNEVAPELQKRKSNVLDNEFPDIDNRAVRQDIIQYENRLESEAGSSLSSGQIKQREKRIRELTSEVEAENANIRRHQEELSGDRASISDAQRNFIREGAEKKAEIRESYSDKIAAEEANVRKAEERLEVAKNQQKANAKLWEAEVKLRAVRDEVENKIKKVESDLRGKVAKAEWKFRNRLSRLSKTSSERRDSLLGQIDDHAMEILSAKRSRKAENDLRKWRNLTDSDKVRVVYGDNYPRLKDEASRQIDSNNPIVDEGEELVEELADVAEEGFTGSSVVGFRPSEGSVGAMEIGGKQINRVYNMTEDAKKNVTRFAFDGSNVPEDLRGRRIIPKFTKHAQSLHTRLSNSKNMAVRGLTYHLFEAPQGGTAAPVTAAARVRNYTQQIRSAMRNRLNEGLEGWLSNQGIGKVKGLTTPKIINDFHKKVMLEVKRPGTFSDEGIIQAAEGVRDQFKVAGTIRRDSGELGFENIDVDSNYVPIIIDNTKVKSAVVEHGLDKVTDLISTGYQRGRFKLNKKLADRVADGYVKRALDNTLSHREMMAKSDPFGIADIAEDLKAAGVDTDIINHIMDETMEDEVKQHISNRAKFSLEPDIGSELSGLRLVDLVDSDLPKLLESYTRDAAGGASMAKLGFSTKNQVDTFLLDIEKSATNSGLSPTEAAEEVQVLRDGIDLLYGRSINKNATSKFVRDLSLLRDMTSFLRLQSVGIASIPELARVTAQRGIGTLIENMDAFHIFAGDRAGKRFSGRFTRPDLEELETMLGYVGEDHVLYPNSLRVDDLEESWVHGELRGRLEAALAQGKRIQEITSGFRLIQGGGEKISARSIGNEVKKLADGLPHKLSDQNIRDAGWSDGFLDQLKSWMQANPKTEQFNGRDIRVFNFQKMPPDMQERLQIGIHRLVARDMQRPLVGELPTIMNRWMGQTLVQFRSFSLLSLSKQLMHDVRHDRIAGSLIFLHSAAMGLMSLGISTGVRYAGRSDFSEKWENAMTGQNLVMGIFNRMGQVASAGIAGDALATLGLLPDELMVPGASGYRGLNTSNVPIVGMSGDVIDIGKDISEILKGTGDLSKLSNDISKITPFAKTIGINQGFNVINDLLE